MKQLNKNGYLLLAFSNSIMLTNIGLWRSKTVSTTSRWIAAGLFAGFIITFAVSWLRKKSSTVKPQS